LSLNDFLKIFKMESNEIALCLATACEFFNTQRSYEMKMQVVLETGSSEVVLPLLNALLHSMRVLFSVQSINFTNVQK